MPVLHEHDSSVTSEDLTSNHYENMHMIGFPVLQSEAVG